jgi:sulfate adenylyltransferase subunit 2
MTDTDGRNIPVLDLNKRRVEAVKLRLAGLAVSEIAKKTGLSQPTVIGAVKAYKSGGWEAVPVGPRGRGVKKARQKAEDQNIKQFYSSPSAPSAAESMAKLSSLTHLQRLEAEAIHIMREVVAEAENPVMLYSIGKDSSVMLHLARKAFYPAPPPFPLLHVDTTWKFRDMYAFRDAAAAAAGMELMVHINPEGIAMGINPFVHGSAIHTDVMKTQGLKQALDKHGFDAAFGGARRDEEKSRAKERIFSFRSAQHRWDPKNQRPELWRLYNMRKHKGESLRVFPLSNWTELDVWQYIHLEGIDVVPLYFSKLRPVVERGGALIMVDDERMPLAEREVPMMKKVRFRTLGCYPLSGAIESEADTLPGIIQEMLLARASERQGRVIDFDSAASMEKKKQEGYF